MIDDVGELIGKQPDVQRVQNCSHTRNRQVRFEVLLVVPAERAYAIAGGNSQPFESACEPAGSFRYVAKRRALAAVLGQRHHLARGIDRTAVFEDRVDVERAILHRALDHRWILRHGISDSVMELVTPSWN